MGKRVNPNDYIGKKFGVLKIIDIVDKDKQFTALSDVKVICDCGKESIMKLRNVAMTRQPRVACSMQCKLYKEYMIQSHRKIDLNSYIGKKINHLTIESLIGKTSYCTYLVHCKCDCGRYADVNLYHLNKGYPTSCGQCNFAAHAHHESSRDDMVGIKLITIHNWIFHKSTLKHDQLSPEWFSDDEPTSTTIRFVSYCRPLYEKCMNDDMTKRIYIHRIDINKPLGPGNIYFDHHQLNIHCSEKVYY